MPHIKGKLATNPYFSSHYESYDDTVWARPAPPAAAVAASGSTAVLTPSRAPPALTVSPSSDRADLAAQREKDKDKVHIHTILLEKHTPPRTHRTHCIRSLTDRGNTT